MDFSNKMKKLRIANGLTQKQLADSLNVSQNAVYNWENGKREPSIDMIKKIAKVFDFPLYLLLDDNFELENAELEMKRARPFKSYEMTEPPKPFAAPLSQTHNKENGIYIDPNLQKLYEAAIEKAVHHEELTEEEEQVIIGIPVQLRPKGDDPLSYENSYSYARSEEEFNKLQKEHQIEIEKKRNTNIHKYNAITSLEITPEQIEINRIQNKILNDTGNVTEEEAKFYNDYYTSEQYKNSLRHLMKTSQENLKIIKRLQTAYETLNEDGQEKVAEHAEMIAKIPEYQKKPPEPPEE